MMAGLLSTWPWQNLGAYKYLLHGPLIWQVLSSASREGGFFVDFHVHVLLIYVLRIVVYYGWSVFSCMLFLNDHMRVIKRGYDFKQIDNEWDWDNYLILQTVIGAMAALTFSGAEDSPLWSTKGLLVVIGIHVFVSEPLFYWLHRFLHSNSFLYTKYHSKQHSSPVLHPFTGVNFTALESLLLTVITACPLVVTYLTHCWSTGVVYMYILTFDFLQCYSHCNVEFLPRQLFETFPYLKFVLDSPTNKTLHHANRTSNFGLLMPIYDVIWGTYDTSSPTQEKIAPDFVFLAHVVSFFCDAHVPFVNRSLCSIPFKIWFFLVPLWPISFTAMLLLWAWAKTVVISSYRLQGRLFHTWGVPRYGFQYFLPFAKKGINDQIEYAILKADKVGVKVLSLAALNKNESLNGGGTLFVEKHPNLKVRIVHGNTLTAAVIINQIPKDCDEVFLTGATSKLGRAIALYLTRRRVRVLMLTHSVERFQKIQKEAQPEFQHHLVQVTKYQAAQSCKTWIVGKWLGPRDHGWAPKGTHFHQFVVPPIIEVRRDCKYGKLAAMKLPENVEGLGSCEYTMGRGVVHACHAGGIVHLLEGYKHHEVGPIDVEQIDVVWDAALKHGLRPS